MKNKSFFLFTVLVTLLLGLIACKPTSPTPPTVTEKPSAAPVEITFWHQYDKVNAALLDILIGEFNATHPDIKVNAVMQPSYDE